MSRCFTCHNVGRLSICERCLERAESSLFNVTPWTEFEKATTHPDLIKEGFDQCWKNSRYTVLVRYMKDNYGDDLVHLSVKRNDKNSMHDWRDMQRIKNEILGDEEEAMELYPAESRLMDTANQYHLWCFPGRRAPFGYNTERLVMEDVGQTGGKQRPFEEKPADLTTEEQYQEKLKAHNKKRQLESAAGDLLEALKECMSQIESFDPGGCAPGTTYDRLKKARAAIAKAGIA